LPSNKTSQEKRKSLRPRTEQEEKNKQKVRGIKEQKEINEMERAITKH